MILFCVALIVWSVSMIATGCTLTVLALMIEDDEVDGGYDDLEKL